MIRAGGLGTNCSYAIVSGERLVKHAIGQGKRLISNTRDEHRSSSITAILNNADLASESGRGSWSGVHIYQALHASQSTPDEMISMIHDRMSHQDLTHLSIQTSPTYHAKRFDPDVRVLAGSGGRGVGFLVVWGAPLITCASSRSHVRADSVVCCLIRHTPRTSNQPFYFLRCTQLPGSNLTP